ncbi:MAG: ISAs1 family transposase, partial [Acetobacteraceae bacterium]
PAESDPLETRRNVNGRPSLLTARQEGYLLGAGAGITLILAGLAAVRKVVRARETPAKTTTETACYLLSTPMTPQRFGAAVRSHWAVENRLHWCLDVTVDEDQMRNRLGNGPQNLAVLRHMALNLVRKETSMGSLPKKLRRAAWSDSYPGRILAKV